MHLAPGSEVPLSGQDLHLMKQTIEINTDPVQGKYFSGLHSCSENTYFASGNPT
jgi:hypothetical protein